MELPTRANCRRKPIRPLSVIGRLVEACRKPVAKAILEPGSQAIRRGLAPRFANFVVQAWRAGWASVAPGAATRAGQRLDGSRSASTRFRVRVPAVLYLRLFSLRLERLMPHVEPLVAGEVLLLKSDRQPVLWPVLLGAKLNVLVSTIGACAPGVWIHHSFCRCRAHRWPAHRASPAFRRQASN